MARTKTTARPIDDGPKESDTPRTAIPRRSFSPAFPSEETILPTNKWLKMVHNNSTIDLDSYPCTYPIFLSIIKFHPWKDFLANHPQVPQVYLQQLWHHMTYRAAQSTQDSDKSTQDSADTTDECLICHVGDLHVDLDVEQLRRVLSLPSYEVFDQIPEDDEGLLSYIDELGYQGDLTSLKALNWDLIPRHWQFLLQLMVHNLTSKERGKDYATRRTLIMWIGFIFNKKYDVAQLIFDELREFIGKRDLYFKQESKRESTKPLKKEIKEPYIPFQRFLQTIVAKVIEEGGPRINPRFGDHHYPEYFTPKFRQRVQATKASGMVIPEHLLARIPSSDDRLRAYRTSLTLMGLSEPIDPSQGVLAPTPREGLVLGEHGEGLIMGRRDDGEQHLNIVEGTSGGYAEVGGVGSNVDVQTPVLTPILVIASPSGTLEGGVEKMVSEGERKKSGDKKKKKKAPSETRNRRRDTTSTILSHVLTENIEKDVDTQSTQPVNTPPLHSSSPLGDVSKYTGTSPHTLTSPHSEPDVIEKESQHSRLSTSFLHESSPHLDNIRASPITPISLRDNSGTVVGRSQSERFRGSTGNPSTANITPAVQEGPSSSDFVPLLDKATSNLSDLGLPKWAIDLAKLPIPGSGKGKEKIPDDPISRIRFHYDIIEARRSDIHRPLPPPPSDEPTFLPPKDSVVEPPEKSSSNLSDYDAVKGLLKTLPRQMLEEVLLDMCLDVQPPSLRDASIIDAIAFPRDYEPKSFEDILRCEQEELSTTISKYRAYASQCRVDADPPHKRKHSDDDPDNNPNEGENERLKRVKLERVETMKETEADTSGGQKDTTEDVVQIDMDDADTDEEIVMEQMDDMNEKEKEKVVETEKIVEKEVEKEKVVEVKVEEVDPAVLFRKTVVERIREGRMYDFENIEKMKPKRYDFDDRLTQDMVRELLDEDLEKERKRLQNEHLELYKFALTNEFGMPRYEKIDRKLQRKWHKRLNKPFMEDTVEKFFQEKPKEVEPAILFGLTKKEKALWHDFKHFVHVKRQLHSQVYSSHGIENIRKIGIEYHNGIKFPTFMVQRSDKKIYQFTEADFKDLNPNDILWFFTQMKNWHVKRRDDRFAESCIKRFMEGQVKEATTFDFQIALESGVGKVNIVEPKRVFPISHVRLWSIVNIEGKGIVYTSPHWQGNVVMLFKDVHCYSTGTLRLILKEIQQIINKGDEHKYESSKEEAKWKLERKEYEMGKDAIVACLEKRKVIQKYEMCLKMRENKYSIFATIRCKNSLDVMFCFVNIV
jgi:hypothetical protein